MNKMFRFDRDGGWCHKQAEDVNELLILLRNFSHSSKEPQRLQSIKIDSDFFQNKFSRGRASIISNHSIDAKYVKLYLISEK